MPLPARVRVTRPPLPLAHQLRQMAARLCPEAPLDALTGATFAIAGGSVIGVHLRWPDGEAHNIETSWRGRGIEQELEKMLLGDG